MVEARGTQANRSPGLLHVQQEPHPGAVAIATDENEFGNEDVLDEGTQQTVDLLNQQMQEDEDENSHGQRRPSELSGLKVQTFGELHRASQAKKNILSSPSIQAVLESVKFEILELPEDLQQSLLLCQRTKELILGTYKQQLDNYLQGRKEQERVSDAVRPVTQSFLQMYRSKTIRAEESQDAQQQPDQNSNEQQGRQGKVAMLLQQASKYEIMLNSCLIERLGEERRFEAFSRLQDIVIQKSIRQFEQAFDRSTVQQLLSEAESVAQQSSTQNTFNLNDLINNFWESLEMRFMNEFLSNNIVELFHQEVETIPEFFVSHYKKTIADQLIDQINKFKADFVTATEEEWQIFVREERKSLTFWENKQAYKSKDLSVELLRVVFSILTVMPIKAEIKLDWHVLESKIARLQQDWQISPKIRCYWQATPEDLDIRLRSLESKLMAQSRENYALGVLTLHKLMFTLLNGFVNGKHYDSKDRALIKLFLDRCGPIFKSVLRLKSDVHVGFFLTLFEVAFGTKTEKDRFDIKGLTKLFGQELLRTLKIEVSIQRCAVLQLDRASSPETKSKHIVICVSGFLQELEDNKQTWQNVVTFYKHAEVYALKWTACNSLDLFDKGVFSGKEQTGMKKILNVLNVFSTGQKQFIFAYDQARLSGSLLAIFLLKSKVWEGKPITLIGFSLGSVVAMHCVRILKYMYRQGFVRAGAVLHDVQLWAGAFVIDPKKEQRERMRVAYHCSVVNGKFWNLWSAKDHVVRHMQPLMQPGTVSIGVQPVMLDIEDDDDGSKGHRKPVNFEVSEEGGNHNHIAGSKDFLPKLPFAY